MSEETTAVLEPPKAAKGKSRPKKTEKKPATAKPPKKGGAKAPKAAAPEVGIDQSGMSCDPELCGRVAELFKQVGDRTRVLILGLLRHSSRNVGQICRHVKQSQPAVSHHLALMRHSGIIRPERDGKFNNYSLTAKGETISRAIAILEEKI